MLGKGFLHTANCTELGKGTTKKRFADTPNGKHTITGHISSLCFSAIRSLSFCGPNTCKMSNTVAKWGQSSKTAINAQVHLQLLPQWRESSVSCKKKERKKNKKGRCHRGCPSYEKSKVASRVTSVEHSGKKSHVL